MEQDILGQTRSVQVTKKDEIPFSAGEVYRTAFARPPYDELFTQEEAMDNLGGLIERGGDVFLRQLNGTAVSLAGGYAGENGIYQIEELAVMPGFQEKGIGRQTLRDLMLTVAGKQIIAFELRTTEKNSKAIGLYRSEGFAPEEAVEMVPSFRQNGELSLDRRIYLFKPLIEGVMPEKDTLKRVVVAYPSGNTTAVVFDQRLSVDREKLNADVMESWKRDNEKMPEIEQCCFVTDPRDPKAVAKVDMFGGEFCGNAMRSVIWLITDGKDYEGFIEVSGVTRPLPFRVKDGVVTAEMPLPEEDSVTQVTEGALVQLDGIAQLVVTNPADRATAQLLRELKDENRYSLAEQPAVGVSYYDVESNRAQFNVWVNEVDTVFDETACGSGTCAIGVALATRKRESVSVNVIQPSGETITVSAIWDDEKGRVIRSEISGTVGVLYDGPLALS